MYDAAHSASAWLATHPWGIVIALLAWLSLGPGLIAVALCQSAAKHGERWWVATLATVAATILCTLAALYTAGFLAWQFGPTANDSTKSAGGVAAAIAFLGIGFGWAACRGVLRAMRARPL